MSIKPTPKSQKFRPYFTAPELLEIIRALQNSPSPNNKALILYLDDFLLKIERGTKSASLDIVGSKTEQLKDGLGIPSSEPENNKYLSGAECYAKKIAGHILTPKQLELCQSYRFENNLMSPLEEAEYLSSNGVSY